MKRIVLIGVATFGMSGAAGLASAAASVAYDCAQFVNPTVNAVWQAVCNAPQSHPRP
jgi:hypothetical protein